jgi:molecular chaperone DnaJ
LRIKIPISIHESITGTHKKIKLQREINCRDCSGTGAKNKESIINCGVCGGTGVATIRQNTQFGQFIQQTTCPNCRGAGKEIKEKCSSCFGAGLKSELDNIEFDIPVGATTGINISIHNLGNEAKGGGDNGNLIVEINDIEHPIFKREGNDIFSDVFISYHDAVSGNDSLEIDTVDGKVNIKIEPGTESGKLLRLKGKGVPNINNPSQRGDQLVFVNIFVPKNITEEEKKYISKLKKIKSAEPDNEKTQHLKGVYSRIREYDDLH